MVTKLPPLIPYLENIKRWVWIGIFGGFALFIVITLGLAATHPDTPANQLIGWTNAWLYLLPIAMVAYGMYISARYWRCPRCKQYLPTRSYQPVWTKCVRCGYTLREWR